MRATFFPRRRGLADVEAGAQSAEMVFSMRAGIDLNRCHVLERCGRFPCAGGDGPNDATLMWVDRKVFPHRWGLTAVVTMTVIARLVFPTQAGITLSRGPLRLGFQCFSPR